MQKDLISFLGNGWSVPPAFHKFSHSVHMVSAIEDIKESIRIILDTFPGERIMQQRYPDLLKSDYFELKAHQWRL